VPDEHIHEHATLLQPEGQGSRRLISFLLPRRIVNSCARRWKYRRSEAYTPSWAAFHFRPWRRRITFTQSLSEIGKLNPRRSSFRMHCSGLELPPRRRSGRCRGKVLGQRRRAPELALVLIRGRRHGGFTAVWALLVIASLLLAVAWQRAASNSRRRAQIWSEFDVRPWAGRWSVSTLDRPDRENGATPISRQA